MRALSFSRSLALAWVLVLTGCPEPKAPLPDGPPPEYEPPRSYDPEKNIDTLEPPAEAGATEAPAPTGDGGSTSAPAAGGREPTDSGLPRSGEPPAPGEGSGGGTP